MTTSAAPTRVIYAGPSATAQFAVQSGSTPIVFADNTHIHVVLRNPSSSIATLVEGTDYTLSGGPSAGVVTLTAGNLATGYSLLIYREQPLQSSFSAGASSVFSSTDINAAFDEARRVDQEINAKIGQAIQLSPFSTGGALPYAPGTLVGQDPSGALTTYDPAIVGSGDIDGGGPGTSYPTTTGNGWGVSGAPGIGYAFNGSTTMGNPGVGTIRFNNATLASITAIAVSAQTGDSGNPNVRAFVASWDDSSSSVRGHVILTKVNAPQNFVVLALGAALTDNTTWIQIPVTVVASGGSFTSGDGVTMQFYRAGDQGSAGTNGTNPTPPTMQVFSSNGTWSRPTGCRKIKFRVQGGGGAGGGAATGQNWGVGGGGGCGGCTEGYLDVTSISSISVTVGSGGTGVSGAAGNNGSASSLGAYASANGGSGGASVSYNGPVYADGGAGGTSTGGSINLTGERGSRGRNTYAGTVLAFGGDGGSSPFGGRGTGTDSPYNIAGTAGMDATGPGSGGGGAATGTNNVAGGAGAAGIVIIDEYY